MKKDNKTEQLSDIELDDVQGGGNMEIQKSANAKFADGSVRPADNKILSSGHGTNNVTTKLSSSSGDPGI
jgi:hypothetical protein